MQHCDLDNVTYPLQYVLTAIQHTVMSLKLLRHKVKHTPLPPPLIRGRFSGKPG